MTRIQKLVDIEFALSQLGGNADLLSRMLIKFKNEFSSMPNDVKNSVNQGDMQDAKLKVHTCKGLSGNLGLMALFECSKVLDQQLREDSVDNEQIEDFIRIMDDTCEKIDEIDLAPNKAPDFSQSTNANNDYKTIFLERLKRHEFIDDETLHKYVDSLMLDDTDKQKVKTFVEDLQYSSAIEIINNMS